MSYVLSRVLQMVISLLAMTIIVFMLVRVTGDPVNSRLSMFATPEERAALAHRLGLDKSVPEQYLIFLGDLVQGDLGKSITFDQPVIRIIKERFPATIKLALVANLFALGLAFPLGIAAAVKKDSIWDVLARLLALVGQSAPAFWVGLMLMYVFAVQFGWLPTSGQSGIKSYVLPATTMALFIMPGTMRLLRSTMIEVLDSEYTKLARGMGWPERLIIWKYALRNATVPVLTFSGMIFLASLTGAVVTETVFAWPGLGRLAVQAVTLRDFPLVQGIVLTFTVFFLLGNLVIDLLYGVVDPRIRYREA